MDADRDPKLLTAGEVAERLGMTAAGVRKVARRHVQDRSPVARYIHDLGAGGRHRWQFDPEVVDHWPTVGRPPQVRHLRLVPDVDDGHLEALEALSDGQDELADSLERLTALVASLAESVATLAHGQSVRAAEALEDTALEDKLEDEVAAAERAEALARFDVEAKQAELAALRQLREAELRAEQARARRRRR